jgi:integration host factor subunit beta
MTGRSKSVTQGLLKNKKEGKMTKSGLIDAIHGKSSNKSALMKGEKVEFRGLGNFKTRTRGIRKARNPRTGEIVKVPSKKVPHFKPGKELREKVERKYND